MKKFGWFAVIVGIVAFVLGVVFAVKASKKNAGNENEPLGV